MEFSKSVESKRICEVRKITSSSTHVILLPFAKNFIQLLVALLGNLRVAGKQVHEPT